LNTPVLIDALVAACYLLAGRGIMKFTDRFRDPLFAVLNLGLVYHFFFAGTFLLFPLAYLLAVICFQAATWHCSKLKGTMPWIAFTLPLVFLILVRYVHPELLAPLFSSIRSKLEQNPGFGWSASFIGLSYLAFRASYLVLEIRNGVVERPGLWRFLGFCFFLPSFSVGPITPYSHYQRGFAADLRAELPLGRSLLRILVGAVKCLFIAPILNQLSYSEFLLDGHHHPWSDVPIAVFAYYGFLYCNFSGFCDIAVGAGGFLGIPVAENFDNPFAARNVKDFWNRWHITLSVWMRDVLFSPLSKALVRKAGPSRANHAIALTILIVFLVVGVWHGAGWNYVAFGAMHALGVVTNHYYGIFLRAHLDKTKMRAYNSNPWVRRGATALTFGYVALSLALFANPGHSLADLWLVLQTP
jgi:D-alanyl-lipoteichoic acid acyltransferase DltB (MBOAT superfamily)